MARFSHYFPAFFVKYLSKIHIFLFVTAFWIFSREFFVKQKQIFIYFSCILRPYIAYKKRWIVSPRLWNSGGDEVDMMEEDLGHPREDSKQEYCHEGAQLIPPEHKAVQIHDMSCHMSCHVCHMISCHVMAYCIFLCDFLPLFAMSSH